MSNNQEVPHVCSLERLVLNEIARKLWRDFSMQDSNNFFRTILSFSSTEAWPDFNDCHNKIVNALPRLLPVHFPKLLRDKLINAVINVQHGYSEALWFEFDHRDLLPFSISEPDAGRYEAILFINPFEHFDDLSWVKLFVSDENQPLKKRFIFATLYCFEEMIYSLWHRMKAESLVPCDGNLEQMKAEFGDYVAWWVVHIEDKIKNGGNFTDDFYVDGLKKAVSGWHEYAARFFFEHCSTEAKNNFLTGIDVSIFSYYLPNNLRFVYFLYSLLSLGQKQDLISSASRRIVDARFWSDMLGSYFRKWILNDILYLLDSIPLNFFANVLYLLVGDYICVSPAPVYNEVFITIWKCLSVEQQREILKFSDLLNRLTNVAINANEFEVFEAIILHLPRVVKEEMLIGNWRNSGHKMIHSFFNLGSYDKALCYLLLFCLEYDAVNHKLSLRNNALSLLFSFTGCKFHVLFIKNKGMSEIRSINKSLDYFREKLPVIDQLVKQWEEETTGLNLNYSAFLSNKIYPLLSVPKKIIWY